VLHERKEQIAKNANRTVIDLSLAYVSAMTSSCSTTQDDHVLTPEFFQKLDGLRIESSTLEDVTRALQQAKDKRSELQRKLKTLQNELRTTRLFCKEQRDRIACVHSHWFYGTTLFQPQLWLRGGCRGKIERASRKLQKAQEEDLPRIQASIQQLEIVELPEVHRQVDMKLDDFELTAGAEKEREEMEDKAISVFRSPELSNLQWERDHLAIEINDTERAADSLGATISQLETSQRSYKVGQEHLLRALEHNNKYEDLENAPIAAPSPLDVLNNPHRHLHNFSRTEIFTSDGTKIVTIHHSNNDIADTTYDPPDVFHLDENGNIISTNFPCPNNCGYLVTWHETHCCNACRRAAGLSYKNNPICHEERCEHKPLTSQPGAQLKLVNRQKLQQALVEASIQEDDAANRRYTEGRKEAKHAERILRQALASVSIFVRERHASVYSSVVNSTINQFPLGSPRGGCQCNQERKSNIQQELDVISSCLSHLQGQIVTLKELQTHLYQEAQNLKSRQEELTKRIEAEKSRILEDLRHRVFGGNVPCDLYHEHPAPSAPMEEDILRDMINCGTNIR